MAKEYQICNTCVMDTSDIDIVFDENGNCNHCTNYFSNIAPRIHSSKNGNSILDSHIETIKKSAKNKEYDCIIGVSGGVDSSFVAYLAVKKGLRPLLVHLDNGWDSEISVQNIRKLAECLKVDYESFVLDWQEFKEIQLAFLKASIPEMETPTDVAIPGALHKVASRHGIKYIISGGNFASEGILPKTWHYNAKDMKYFNDIMSKNSVIKVKKFPKFGWVKEVYYKYFRGIKQFYILNYYPYNKDDARSKLENDLGWKYYGGKHYESKYTGLVQSYIMPEKFNMDYRRATLSTEICSGKVTRSDALQILKSKAYKDIDLDKEKKYLCKKFSITESDFDEIMKSEPKNYRDYKNSEGLLHFIYNIYFKLTGKSSYKGQDY